MKYWRKPLDADRVKPTRGRVIVLKDRCKGCRFCIEFCPKQVLAESTEFTSKGYHPPYAIRGDECVNCGLCQLVCPDFAIEVVPVEDEVAEESCHA